MAADNTRRQDSWTIERMLQIAAPFALLAGVALLILVQLISTPRGKGQAEQVEERRAPTAVVRLSTPTSPSVPPAVPSNASAAPAPATVLLPTVGETVAPARYTGAEVLPTIQSVNCKAPASADEQVACRVQSATEAVEDLPAALAPAVHRTVSEASGPAVGEPAPISNLQPIPTSPVYSCAEVTSPLVSCRGARP